MQTQWTHTISYNLILYIIRLFIHPAGLEHRRHVYPPSLYFLFKKNNNKGMVGGEGGNTNIVYIVKTYLGGIKFLNIL